MQELDGHNAVTPPGRQMVSRRSNLGLAVGFLVLVLATGGVVYWRTHQPAAPVEPLAPVASPTPAPVAAPAPVDDAPPVDAKVHPEALMGALSSAPEWAGWVKEPKLIQRLTAATNMVAAGDAPRPVLGFLAPHGEFSAATQDGNLYATPASHARFDVVTKIVTSLDAAKAGAVYAQLSGYFQHAFREIGRPGERFTPVLHKAIGVLRATPVPAAEPELVEKGANYLYADPQLEALQPAQKQLLRMGNANARAIQAWLGAFDRALPAR